MCTIACRPDTSLHTVVYLGVDQVDSAPPLVQHRSHRSVGGMVLTVGQGDVGQLGLGEDVLERKFPQPVVDKLQGERVVQLVCGGMHTVALTESGKVHMCTHTHTHARTHTHAYTHTHCLLARVQYMVVQLLLNLIFLSPCTRLRVCTSCSLLC